MPKLLSGFIAKQVGKLLGPQVKPATLIKVTNGVRTTASGGTHPTTTSYAARGFVEGLAAVDIDGTLITRTDVKVCLLAATIAGGQKPSNGDKVTIEGTTYTVLALLDRDPDAAMYSLAARA